MHENMINSNFIEKFLPKLLTNKVANFVANFSKLMLALR